MSKINDMLNVYFAQVFSTIKGSIRVDYWKSQIFIYPTFFAPIN